MYIAAGKKNNVLVIPVGIAFENAYELNPNIKLHKSFDGGEGEDGILAELARTRTPNLNIVVVSWVSARGRLLV